MASTMYVCKLKELLQWILFLELAFRITTGADVGTAAYYTPPYLPTACYGNDVSQFPANNLFAAAGEEIWDNGAACGSQYLVRCLSAAMPRACVLGQTIMVEIVDQAATLVLSPSRSGSTLVLSTVAFAKIANQTARVINVEFIQV